MGIGVGAFVPSPIFFGGRGLMSRYEAGVRSDGGSFAFPIDTGLASRLEGLGLLNASSLVNSCNAGKESVLYNLIPTPVQSLDRFAVTRSTVKWVLGANGLLQEIPANTPAFEYNTDGTYRGLLVEPAGTNLLLRSEEFDNATWGKEATSSITATNGIAPNGTATADTYTLGATPGSARIQQSFTVSSGATITNSVFIKKSVGTHIRYVVIDSATATNGYGAWFNLDTGAVGTSAGFGTGTFVSASIQALPNSWYRISISGSIAATTGYQTSLYIATADNSGTRLANGAVLLWGAQAETGSVATSYIPTVASTQTRTADSVTLTGAGSLIGQSAGTIYVEMEGRLAGANRTLISVSDGTNNNRINLQVGGGNTTEARIVSGGVAQGAIDAGAPSASVRKWALRYSSSGATLYRDGASVGTPLGAITIPATSIVRLGVAPDGSSNFLNGWLRSAVLFTSDIGNTSAIALTTP